MRHFPPSLKPGGTIGIVSPARWLPTEQIKKAAAVLKKNGYNVVIHPQNYLKDGLLAGSDIERGRALTDMFADDRIDAIMCTRGGGDAIRTLDRVDFKIIKRNPKIFIGFSDLTLFLQSIYEYCGFVTYHGPMLWNFCHPRHRRTEEDFFAVMNARKDVTLRFPDVECARAGKATGILTGGNITRLVLLSGTAYDWCARDAILFIEDVNEVMYKLDEKLHQMRLAGRFKGVKAVLVGEMVDIGDGETMYMRKGEKHYGRNLRQIFTEIVPPHIPLCFNFPCGHGKNLTTLPIGSRADLVLNKSGATLKIKCR
jgi:muramoyltetrapeptide carboxypeptidase